MRKLTFVILSTCLILSVPFVKKTLSEEVAGQIEYEKPGSYVVKTLEFPDLKDPSRNNRSVPLKVHFPAKGKDFPLVIISHGGAGTWDANIYQAQHVASHGYMVICPEHVYSNNIQVKYYMSKAGGKMKFMEALHQISKDPRAVLERPRDISFAIDMAMLWNKENKQLMGKINTKRVAVMGHSFGAYTTLVVCGARPILDHLEPAVGSAKGLADDLSDPRITFGFAMSPQSPGTTYFGKDSYKTINRPLVCLSGSKDAQKSSKGRLMLPYRRLKVLKLLPQGDKYFLWLKNADHNSFSDNPKAYVLPSKARSDVQRVSKAMMVLFCDWFLKGKEETINKMNKEYINSLCGNVVTEIRWYEK